MPDDTIIDTRAAAGILGCSLRTVHRLVETGKLDATLTGGAYVFRADVVAAYLAEQKAATSAAHDEGLTPA